MSFIVKSIETNKVYILVGTSYSYFKDSRESIFGGALFPHEEEGTYDLVAVTDETGIIQWIPSSQIEVIEIDGVKPKDILSMYANNEDEKVDTENTEKCPACGTIVKIDEQVCHSCGLTLIL